MASSKVGIWLIGAKGGVAATAILGLAALQRGIVSSTGLVTQLPRFQRLPLADWGQLVVAGHEIRRVPLAEEVARMAAEGRTALADTVEHCRGELERINARIRPGTILGVGDTIAAMADADLPHNGTPRQAVARLGRDMAEFVRAEGLAQLVVVNVASTEPAADAAALPSGWAELERLLVNEKGGQSHFRGDQFPSPGEVAGAAKIGTVPFRGDQVPSPGEVAGAAKLGTVPCRCPLPASSLYAIAAIGAGHSYINFTPSLGAAPAAIDELAGCAGAATTAATARRARR